MVHNWFGHLYCILCASLVAQLVKNLPVMQETWVWSLGQGDLLEKWLPTPVFLPRESPWTEEPGGLQSMGLQRVGHDWATKHTVSYVCYYNKQTVLKHEISLIYKYLHLNNNFTNENTKKWIIFVPYLCHIPIQLNKGKITSVSSVLFLECIFSVSNIETLPWATFAEYTYFI